MPDRPPTQQPAKPNAQDAPGNAPNAPGARDEGAWGDDDARLLRGSPGQPPAEGAQPDAGAGAGDEGAPPDDAGTQPGDGEGKWETVQVGSLNLEVDPDTAAQLREQLNALQRPAPREPSQAPQQQQPAQPDDPLAGLGDVGTRILTEPAKVLREVYDLAVRDTQQSLRGEYRQTEALRSFWNDFYQENEDLAGERMLVNAVLQRDQAALAPLTPADAGQRLADAARRELLRIRGVKPNGSGDGKHRARPVTKPNQSSQRGRQAPDEGAPKPRTLGQIIRETQVKKYGRAFDTE